MESTEITHPTLSKKHRSRRFRRIGILLGIGVILWIFLHKTSERPPRIPETYPVTLSLNGLILPGEARNGETVGNFLDREHISFGENDLVIPAVRESVVPGMEITLIHAKHFVITGKDVDKSGITLMPTVERLLAEQRIFLNENDLSTPRPDMPLSGDTEVNIIRVDISEYSVKKPIDFEVIEKEDSALSWRKTIVEQKGEPGVREYTYRILSHDGKEVERKLVSVEVTKEPTLEKRTQGTLVKVGKTHTGLGTWYAFTGTLAAASPWLPMGSYARVVNTANGKSVIVKINDRGPFGKNRIIDLDKVAFEKIASVGAGVIEVRVEEITN